MTTTQFVLRNDLPTPLTLNIEPEGAFVPLHTGEEAVVFDSHTKHPVTIKLSNTPNGEFVLSLWPGDGDLRVEKVGVDVLDALTPDGVVV